MKRWATLFLACCLFFGLAACAGKERNSGEVYEQEGMQKNLQTAFFDFQVNAASLTDEIEDYAPSTEKNSFLIVNVTIKNTFKDDNSIPMFDTDFMLGMPDLDTDNVFCEENVATTQLPEEYEILKGESRTGDFVFIVPQGQTRFALEYLEIYEDEFEGNTFRITFELEE